MVGAQAMVVTTQPGRDPSQAQEDLVTKLHKQCFNCLHTDRDYGEPVELGNRAIFSDIQPMLKF